MKKTLPIAVAAFAMTAVVFSTAPRAADCTPNNLGSTCSVPQVAYQQSPAPQAVQGQPAPDRYPGPALQSNNGGSDGSGGGGQ